MENQFVTYIYLILIILGLVMLANRLKLAYPIVLVLGGLAISFAPGFSKITIDPDIVFLVFLPPLLYEAAWQTSWKEFWKWRRVITSFAFPVVILTSCVIAFVSNALIPGFTLALGFLLGGIISPPDAISATTIMRRVNISKSMMSITEGESLLNDASSLIVFRFAIAAVITGQFVLAQAAGTFFMVVVMGTLIGLAIGGIFYAIHKYLPTNTSIEILLTIVTPYCMYYAAEHFHYSGVLAVVSGGLLLSNKRQSMLTYRSRIQATSVWDSLVFIMNGLVFMLIGLQLPSIIEQLDGVSLGSAIGYALIISLVLIVMRLICSLGASVFTRFMSRFITVADDNPGWKGPLILGWSGMRGVVSLAMALSIPLVTSGEEAFPYRALILFITFVVILVTLVLQGLTLPWLIRLIKPEDRFHTIPEDRQEVIIQKKMALYALQYLEENFSGSNWPAENEHFDNLRSRLQIDLKLYTEELEEPQAEHAHELLDFYQMYLGLLDHQRMLLDKMNNKSEFDEDLIRKYHTLVDIDEFKVREKMTVEG